MLNIRKTNKNTRRKRSRTGVVAAEMAVVLPVFLIVFFGFIEVARLSFAVNSTQVALIKSARTLSLPNATADAGRKAAEDYLNGVGVRMDNLVITVTPEDLNRAVSEVSVQIQFDMAPVPYSIDRTITRSRE